MATYTESVTDTLTLTEQRYRNQGRDVSETVNMSDSLSTSSSKRVSESFSLSETIVEDKSRRFGESLQITESILSTLSGIREASDAISIVSRYIVIVYNNSVAKTARVG